MAWLGGLPEFPDPARQRQGQTGKKLVEVERTLRELDHQVRRLTLLNQALWELLQSRLQLDDEDLRRVVQEIDLRDGVADGCVTEVPLKCPTCGRISNSRHWKCLYCGQEFEKPVMG